MGFPGASCWTNTHPEEEAPGPWVSAACPQWQQQHRVGSPDPGRPTGTLAPHGSEVGRVEPRPLVPGLVPPLPSCLVSVLPCFSASPALSAVSEAGVFLLRGKTVSVGLLGLLICFCRVC